MGNSFLNLKSLDIELDDEDDEDISDELDETE